LNQKKMILRKFVLILALLTLSGCSNNPALESTATPLRVLPTVSPQAWLRPTARPTIEAEDTNTPEGGATSIFRTELRPTLIPLEPTGMLGSVIRPINIRSGPAQFYPSLGKLDYGNILKLTGRDLQNQWYQFEYPDGPAGHAWAAAGFIKVVNGDPLTLPVFDDQGRPLP